MKSHILSKHSSVKPYKCEICKFAFKTYSNLKRHKKIHSDDWDAKPIKCKCGKSFSRNSKSIEHFCEHPSKVDRIHECEGCNKNLFWQAHLKGTRNVVWVW